MLSEFQEIFLLPLSPEVVCQALTVFGSLSNALLRADWDFTVQMNVGQS